MGNPFVHVELQTQDPETAMTFYAELFEWEFEDHQVGETTYTLIDVGEGTGGGLMKHPEHGSPSMWLAYILVDDVGATTDRAKVLGGQAIVESMEVPGYGWLSIIVDPTGAVFGIWQPKPQE